MLHPCVSPKGVVAGNSGALDSPMRPRGCQTPSPSPSKGRRPKRNRLPLPPLASPPSVARADPADGLTGPASRLAAFVLEVFRRHGWPTINHPRVSIGVRRATAGAGILKEESLALVPTPLRKDWQGGVECGLSLVEAGRHSEGLREREREPGGAMLELACLIRCPDQLACCCMLLCFTAFAANHAKPSGSWFCSSNVILNKRAFALRS